QLAAYPPRNEAERGPLRRSSVLEGHYNAIKSGLHVRAIQAPRKGESLVDAVATRYGYGWVAEQTCAFDEVGWHNGGVDGYRTDVAFVPEQGVGVIALINLGTASPEVIVNRALTALLQTGGLSRRTPGASPAFEPVMKKFLDVYNVWDEGRYNAML